MPLMATTVHPEDFFRTKRQTNGMGQLHPEDFFRTKRQLSGDSPSQWETNGGYPLGWPNFGGPTPGDPDYEAPPEEGSGTVPTTVPTSPNVVTTQSSWYENPWVLGGIAVVALLGLGYLAKRASFAGMDDGDWGGMGIQNMGYAGDYSKGRDFSGGDCGCNG